MTRIALDPDRAVHQLGQLGSVRHEMSRAGAEVLRPHFGLFPPSVLAMLMAEQARIGGGLKAGAGVIQLRHAEIALRVAAFQLADGGTIDARVLDAIATSGGLADVDPQYRAILDGGVEAISDIGGASDVASLTVFGFLRLAERALPSTAPRTTYKLFDERWSKAIVGKAGGRVLLGVHIATSLPENYADSSAATFYGKASSAALGTFVTAHPVFGVADMVSGGSVSGVVDAPIVLVESTIRFFSGDAAGASATVDEYTNAALRGEKGPLVKPIAQAGHWLGGAAYDAGEWVGNIKRPRWLGGG